MNLITQPHTHTLTRWKHARVSHDIYICSENYSIFMIETNVKLLILIDVSMSPELDFQYHHPPTNFCCSSVRSCARSYVNIHWHEYPSLSISRPFIFFYIQSLATIKINSSAKFIKIWINTHYNGAILISMKKFKRTQFARTEKMNVYAGKFHFEFEARKNKPPTNSYEMWGSIFLYTVSSISIAHFASRMHLNTLARGGTRTHTHQFGVFLFWFCCVINVYIMWLVYECVGRAESFLLNFPHCKIANSCINSCCAEAHVYVQNVCTYFHLPWFFWPLKRYLSIFLSSSLSLVLSLAAVHLSFRLFFHSKFTSSSY